jgi:hypothetical protein
MSETILEGHNCWIVIIDELDPPELIGPMTHDQLVEKLRRMAGQRVSVFPFVGRPYRITAGPFRRLLTPDGLSIPLFDEPNELEVDPSGLLYDPDKTTNDDPPEDED